MPEIPLGTKTFITCNRKHVSDVAIEVISHHFLHKCKGVLYQKYVGVEGWGAGGRVMPRIYSAACGIRVDLTRKTHTEFCSLNDSELSVHTLQCVLHTRPGAKNHLSHSSYTDLLQESKAYQRECPNIAIALNIRERRTRDTPILIKFSISH